MKKIEAGTIVRTIILALALINQVLVMSGHSVIPVSYTHLDVYKRQVPFPTGIET